MPNWPAVITIGIDPEVHLGPLTLAWHGVFIAVGLAVGAYMARRYAPELGLDRDTVLNLVIVLGLAGVVGSRVLYLVLDEPGALLHPEDWLGTRGFAFYGALIAAPVAAALYMRSKRLSPRYLDVLAAGFPLGMAVGRLGDVINGEHYGPPSSLPWAFRYTSPNTEAPSTLIAYHSGGFYEVVLAIAIFALIWLLRHRFERPLTLFWSVIGLYAAGRFVMFFFRSDTTAAALGLNAAQWTSLALLAVAGVGLVLTKVTNRLTEANG